MAEKKLVIQIQLDLLLTPNKEKIIQEFIAFLSAIPLIDSRHINRGEENGLYINIELQSSMVEQLWKKIKSVILLNSNGFSVLSKGIVVVCEGDHGWNDYLQLYHYNKLEKIDSFDPGNAD